MVLPSFVLPTAALTESCADWAIESDHGNPAAVNKMKNCFMLNDFKNSWQLNCLLEVNLEK